MKKSSQILELYFTFFDGNHNAGHTRNTDTFSTAVCLFRRLMLASFYTTHFPGWVYVSNAHPQHSMNCILYQYRLRPLKNLLNLDRASSGIYLCIDQVCFLIYNCKPSSPFCNFSPGITNTHLQDFP